jgi:glyoxylase-like metal-dependent hydrolase (beta-lactamase superfamily II)
VDAPTLPATVRVIVRDWLNANNIVLLQPGHNAVVDTGQCAHETLDLLRQPHHLGAEPLHLVVSTHCHSDHSATTWAATRFWRAPTAAQWLCRKVERR